ncbi:MAG TPA: alpha/beta hydrolase [Cyclobacteriaceae bacterium]|nr:alpha/beta hydrolase [Cyclobacteriaceae bacterium]
MTPSTTPKRRFRIVVILLIFISLMISFHSCMTFRMSKKEIDEFFVAKKINGSQHQYKSGKYTIHYAQAGDDTNPLILFVHGSPGSLSAFIDFLADTSLTHRALTITTDRPGFGHSNFGMAESSLEKQAATLKPILEKFKGNRPIILVGHSLGGPVIARMAMDYPDLVDGLVFVAASIDPELEPNETWFRAPLATPFLSWVLPRSWRASNEEIYQLKPQLEEMLPLWNKVKCPVVVIQGKKDSLVPAGNSDFAKKMLVNAPVDIMLKDEMDHFVPWSNPELIREAVLRLLKTPDKVHAQSADQK